MIGAPEKHSFGFEWAHELEEGILKNLKDISCMELIPENFFDGRFESFLKSVKDQGTPVAVHGVQLSIGSMEPLNEAHLNKMLEVGNQVNMVNFSEHLALTAINGIDLDALTPLCFDNEVLDNVTRKIEQVQKRLQCPFLLENVSWRFIVPESEYEEPEFLNKLVDRTGCGIILDVTNVYTNSVNFNFNPYEYIDRINADAVQLVHLAGGQYDKDGFLMDSHDSTVEDGSWDLYSYFLKKAPPFMTIVERTGSFPKVEALMEELKKARQIAKKALKFRNVVTRTERPAVYGVAQ